MIRFPAYPFLFFIDWSSNVLLFCGLFVPIYLIIRQAGKGLIAGALSFWLCMTAAILLRHYAGEDMDMATGCYPVAGWLIGLLYCWSTLAVVDAWRQWRPNPNGYCPKCGRALNTDQNICTAGHTSINA